MSTNGVHDSDELQPGEARREAKGTTRGKKLCPTCQSLDLSVDKFVIYGGKSRPFKTASNAPFPLGEHHHRSDFSLKSGSRTYQIGTFSDIQARSETCPFCYLVLKSVEKPASSSETNADAPEDTTNHISPPTQLNLKEPNPNAICYVNWEVDGRDNERFSVRRARTRRLHLHWDSNDKTLKDSYLVFVAPQRLFEFNSDSQGSWETEAFFLGRELRTDGNNQVLMKSWLDQCCQHHGEGCSGNQNREFIEMASQSYFGVIDVLDMCLKSLPSRTMKDSNKDSFNRHFGNSPSTSSRSRSPVGDSTDDNHEPVVYEPYVALSYVWGTRKNFTTDTSNIRVHQQQGSLETFLEEIPRVIRDAMSLVRRLGLRYLWVDSLCIVQNSKRSWNLNSRVMNLIYGNAFLTICAADGNDAWFGLKALDSSAHSISQYIEECAPGVRLMVSQLAETGINASVWNTRAWTFQERLLSRRCLIFTEGRVFFQCRSATMSEDLVSESHGAGWSLDLAKALPQILHELDRRPIRVYMNCMSRYSERNLTQPKDILAAFNGVSNLISGVMKAPFIFGLPSSHFDLALLWEPLQSVSRRVQEEGQDFQDLAFPSWSWCGWKGGPTEYRASQLEGALINVHEWLKEHTWIAWYIRDGRGNLRPIWDGRKSAACDSVEERWKGYEVVSPNSEFVNLQAKALKNLAGPNEDDFIKRSEEQEQAEIEDKLMDLEKKKPLVKNSYQDDYEDGGHYQQHYHRRRGGRSPSPVRRREIIEIEPRGRYVGPDGINEQEKPRTFRDEYGRNLSSDIARKIRSGFQQCLPDNPFRVYIENYTAEPDKDFPDQPLLQFWTWWTTLRLVRSTTQTTDLPGLSKYDIADKAGDWCGSIMLDKNWIEKEEKRGHKVDGSSCDFLAISDAKAFTKEECDVWTYYVPKERENSEWDLYYVLLVEQKDRIWSRVALGKVFKASFENAIVPKRWREIILA
ncbi:hypothetical protein G7Y89_g10785 [Cudoniella acicularis]|uniref:Heterokaryon incompatibility domain-containing protein n=1 Tax=Cudoniella acicularis TaxID=354080 RepID=A0A8H4VYN9_9HELO|nr:hypothetical protein G7Y89_g10785 [Cudoniella acicularis]